MEELNVQKSYAEFKNALDTEFNTAAESFNRIGYLLKVARDTDILRESGYKTVAEFANAEYGLRKDDVSRFIAINDRYSENGYSERLAEKYRGFGRAKLQEMLSLPVEIADEIPVSTPKSVIQEIKKEYKEEQAITGIELMLEDENKEQQEMDNNLAKVLHQLLHDRKDLFKAVEKIAGMKNAEMLYDALAPSGVETHIVRIAGVGRFMLSITDLNDNLSLMEMRSANKESYEWYDAVMAVYSIFENKKGKDLYFEIYGEPYEESKVEPVQQEEPKAEIEKPVAEKPEEEQTIEPDTEETETAEAEDVEVDVKEHSESIPEEEPEEEYEEESKEDHEEEIQQAAVPEEPDIVTEPDSEEIMNPYVEEYTSSEESDDVSEEIKQMCISGFYRYFSSRIDDSYDVYKEIHDILFDDYKAHIIINDEYSVLTDSGFIVEKNSIKVAEISIQDVVEYIDIIKANVINKNHEEKLSIIENTLIDIKKSVDKKDYLSAVQYAERLLGNLKKIIEEENHENND